MEWFYEEKNISNINWWILWIFTKINKNELPIGIRSIKIISHDYRYRELVRIEINENKQIEESFNSPIDIIDYLLDRFNEEYQEKQIANITNDEFLICEKIGGGNTVSIACNKINRDLKLIPFGSIAIHISSITNNNKERKLQFSMLKGSAFTFLPLPIEIMNGMTVLLTLQMIYQRHD